MKTINGNAVNVRERSLNDFQHPGTRYIVVPWPRLAPTARQTSLSLNWTRSIMWRLRLERTQALLRILGFLMWSCVPRLLAGGMSGGQSLLRLSASRMLCGQGELDVSIRRPVEVDGGHKARRILGQYMSTHNGTHMTYAGVTLQRFPWGSLYSLCSNSRGILRAFMPVSHLKSPEDPLRIPCGSS